VAVSKRERVSSQLLAKQERKGIEVKKQASYARILPASNTKHKHTPTQQAWQHKAAEPQESSVVEGAAFCRQWKTTPHID
jgi:hypothetical protein